MTSKQTGDQAERAVEAYLLANGYRILDRNWRHRRAEIDIVAAKDGTAYFVEVKYRRTTRFGRGFEYITAAKQRQMGFAADLWLVKNRWYGPYMLAAAEVTGPRFAVTGYVTCIY